MRAARRRASSLAEQAWRACRRCATRFARRLDQITPHIRIPVAVEPVDFRAGIDGLAAVCRKRLQAEPMTGMLFAFASRRRATVRILVHDEHGARVTILERRLQLASRAHKAARLDAATELQDLYSGKSLSCAHQGLSKSPW